MIGNNFPIKTITENCGNKYITILHNSPNEKILKTLKNSAFKQIWRINISHFKVAEDDIAFKLTIFKKIIAFERQYMLL